MSSATPAVSRELVETFGPRAVDAPVGGGPEAAQRGGLLVFLGGSEAERDRWGAVLEPMATRIIPTGVRGGGYATKLLANALWFTHAIASAEVLTLASKLGLDLAATVDALRAGAADSRFLG